MVIKKEWNYIWSIGLTKQSFNKIQSIIEKYNKFTFKIFCSRARGDYKKESDIDLAIMDDVDAKTKFNIMNDFDMIEIPYQIDLVFVIDVQKKEFLNSIERDGVVFDE